MLMNGGGLCQLYYWGGGGWTLKILTEYILYQLTEQDLIEPDISAIEEYVIIIIILIILI